MQNNDEHSLPPIRERLVTLDPPCMIAIRSDMALTYPFTPGAAARVVEQRECYEEVVVEPSEGWLVIANYPLVSALGKATLVNTVATETFSIVNGEGNAVLRLGTAAGDIEWVIVGNRCISPMWLPFVDHEDHGVFLITEVPLTVPFCTGVSAERLDVASPHDVEYVFVSRGEGWLFAQMGTVVLSIVGEGWVVNERGRQAICLVHGTGDCRVTARSLKGIFSFLVSRSPEGEFEISYSPSPMVGAA